MTKQAVIALGITFRCRQALLCEAQAGSSFTAYHYVAAQPVQGKNQPLLVTQSLAKRAGALVGRLG